MTETTDAGWRKLVAEAASGDDTRPQPTAFDILQTRFFAAYDAAGVSPFTQRELSDVIREMRVEIERLQQQVRSGVEFIAHLQGITDQDAIEETISRALGVRP